MERWLLRPKPALMHGEPFENISRVQLGNQVQWYNVFFKTFPIVSGVHATTKHNTHIVIGQVYPTAVRWIAELEPAVESYPTHPFGVLAY